MKSREPRGQIFEEFNPPQNESGSPPLTDEQTPDEPGDEDLMRRSGQGDADAFEIIVRRYQHRVASHAYRMIGDMAAAEDVTQQTFIQAWRAAARYRPSAQLITWLLRIARNLVLNEVRRRQRKPAQSLDAENLPESFTSTQSFESPDAQASSREIGAEVERAVLALPEKQREALLLVRHQELSYEEIAVILKTTVPSIKSLVFRARAELKERLRSYLQS